MWRRRLPSPIGPLVERCSRNVVAGAITPICSHCRCKRGRLCGPNADALNHGGTPEFAAISAVAMRHNDISNTLSTAPDRFEPIYRRKPNRDIDARPWCRGFYAAMQLRMSAWAPLLNIDDINYGLLLPIFAHCVDDQGRPLLGPTRKGPEGKAFLRKAYTDIPAVVEAMRQYWMPTRYRRDA